jgi:ribulose-phosphate 3-epimerase
MPYHTPLAIIPAIMPTSVADLYDKIERVAPLSEHGLTCVQIDIMDGVFVPSISWPYADKGNPTLLPELAHLTHTDTILYELDMMVLRPMDTFPQWYARGVRRFIIHIEALADPYADITLLRRWVDVQDESVELGLAIGTQASLTILTPLLPLTDMVQCMGIARIGYQGEGFDERVLTHITTLRASFPKLILSVDGSVNKETLPRLFDAGARRFAVGSALFSSPDITATFNELRISHT